MASSEGASGEVEVLERERPAYLQEVTDKKFLNISIKGYEKKTSGGFTKEEYFAYRIVSILTDACEPYDPQDLPLPSEEDKKRRQEVWRRYSEFELLRNFLLSVYPHVVVPPLPEKAIKGSSGLLNKLTFTGEDTDFLLKRQQALEIFLVRVSRHPVLSLNTWFHQFMHNIGWRDSLQKSGYTPRGDSMLSNLAQSLSKQKPDSRFQDVKEYATELESTFKTLLDIREKMSNSMEGVYKVHSNYGRILSEWSELEDSLGTPLQIAGGCMDSYAVTIDTYFEEEEVRYLLPLKEYVGFCDSLRAVVRHQEGLQKSLERSEEILSEKSEAKETLSKENPETGGSGGSRFSMRMLTTRLRGGDTSYFGRMKVATRELQEAEEAAKSAQKELEAFTEASIHELESFNVQKVSDFRSILINFVQLQMHLHRKGITSWERMQQAFQSIPTA